VTETLLFFLGGRADRVALVVKVGGEGGKRVHCCGSGRRVSRAGSEALERHRQQVWRLILQCFELSSHSNLFVVMLDISNAALLRRNSAFKAALQIVEPLAQLSRVEYFIHLTSLVYEYNDGELTGHSHERLCAECQRLEIGKIVKPIINPTYHPANISFLPAQLQ